MIDCENEVYSRVVDALNENFDAIDCASEYVDAPSEFPHVSIVQTDNTTVASWQDVGGQDNLVNVTFEVNIYSNKAVGRKSECKQIAYVIDDVFQSMNFRRTVMSAIPNVQDASIYRIVMRFMGRTDGNYFYRR